MRKALFLGFSMMLIAGFAFAAGQQEKSAAAGQPVTLQVWNVFDPALPGDGKEHEQKYAEYSKLHPGITIQHNIMQYDQLRQKFIVAGQAQQGPDEVHMLGEWVPDFVSMGFLEDITSPMKAWSDYGSFPESTWKVASVDGKIYGVPSIASTRVLVYRDDLLSKAGISVPKTWADLRDAAKKLTAAPSQYGMAFCSSSKAVRGPQEFAVLLWSTGGELVKLESGKWVPGFTVAQAKEVFQLYYDLMFTDQAMPPDSIGWEWDQLDPAFQAGQVAMVQNGSWMRGRADQADTGKSWKTAAFPYDKVPATYLEVKVEGISKFSQHKQETIDFMKWLYSRDNMVYVTQFDNLPSRSDSKDSPFWKNDPIWRGTFLDTVSAGHSMPSIPFGPALKLTMDEVQQVLYKKASPDQAAQDFFTGVKSYLDTSVNK